MVNVRDNRDIAKFHMQDLPKLVMFGHRLSAKRLNCQTLLGRRASFFALRIFSVDLVVQMNIERRSQRGFGFWIKARVRGVA